MTTIKKDIGDIIKTTRTDKGISASRLAELLGVSNGYISRIENGSSKPSESLLYKLAYELEIPIHLLFDDVNAFVYDLKNRDWYLDGYHFTKSERDMWLEMMRTFIQNKNK